MKVIKTPNIGRAHEHVVRLIMREHIELLSEDNELTWEYPEPITMHISQAGNAPMTSSCSMFGEKFMAAYVEKVCEITPRKNDGTDAVYTYGNRLRDYPWYSDNDEVYLGDGDGEGIDQIDHIIKALKENPQTRRAIAHTWFMEYDHRSSEPPCLQTIQFLLRNDSLNLVAYFRSNDMLSAWGANAYALAKLQSKVAHELRVGRGYLETISISAHIYPVRDAHELSRFKI